MSENGNRLHLRDWLRLAWHTRPGHRPAGMFFDAHHAYCLACGAMLDRTRPVERWQSDDDQRPSP